MNEVDIISKMMNFTELYNLTKIIVIDIYQGQKWPKTETCGTPYFTEALLDILPLIGTSSFLSKRQPFICNTMYAIMPKLC